MAAAELGVEVVYCASPSQIDRVALRLPAGSTLQQALQASGLLQRHADVDAATARFGIFGRVAPLERVLRDGDRVELYRPLQVDPKQARRLRAIGQRELNAARSPKR